MKTEFNYLWTFLITCAFYKVAPSKVLKNKPVKNLAKVKRIAAYLIYNQGASGREVGDIIGIKTWTVRYHLEKVKAKMQRNEAFRKEIKQLQELTY